MSKTSGLFRIVFLSLFINSAFVLYALGQTLVLVSKPFCLRRVAFANEEPNEERAEFKLFITAMRGCLSC